MGRLSDEELDEALAVAQSLNSLRLTAAVAELKERRAEDLNAEERNALRSLQRELIAESETLADYGANVVAVAALSKLLTRGNR